MSTDNMKQTANRRDFLGKVTGAAVLLGATSLITPADAFAGTEFNKSAMDAEAWFNMVKGKHRMIFDCTEPKEIFPFAWPKIFLVTNAATGTPEKDCGVVRVLRHSAIPYGLNDSLWEKYKFGAVFKINAWQTTTPATANPFWETTPDKFKIPGIGAVPLGIRDLQASGVMFCVCEMAISVNSAVMAMKMNLDPADVKKEWLANLNPGF